MGLGELAIATGAVEVAIGLIVAGAGAAFTYVPAFAIATRDAGSSRAARWRSLGIASSGIGIGIVIATVMATLTRAEVSSTGWRWVWASEAVFAVLTALVVTLDARRRDLDLVALSGRARRLSSPRHWRTRGPAYFCFGVAYAVFANLSVKTWELGGLSKAAAATSLLIVAPAIIVAGFATPFAMTHWNPRVLFSGSFAVMAAAVTLVAVSGHRVWAAWCAAALGGMVSSSIPVQLSGEVRSELADRADADVVFTSMFGALSTMYATGALIGLLAGAIFDGQLTGLTWTFLAAGVLPLVGGVLVFIN